MAFQPTTEGALCRIRYSWGTVLFENHLWFRQTTFDTNDLNLLAEAVAGFAADNWVVGMSNQVKLESVEAIDMRTQGASSATYIDGVSAGADSGDMLPLSLAVVITVRTALRGRSYRGRIYLAGLCEELIDDGIWNATLVANLEATFDALVTALTGTGFTFGVRSGQINKVPRTNAIVVAATGFDVRSRAPGSQRRRVKRP